MHSSLLEAYKSNFEYLVRKGFEPKVNVMDNQATKAIKAYLTPQQVMLQLAEPHTHRVNAAELAIQTCKNRFIGTLGTTDSEFPFNCGTSLPLKYKTTSTFSGAHALVQTTSQHMKCWKDLTISIVTH
jgi:hypothetical protein